MGKRRRRCTGLDWIFNPMGMGKKRCALFNPMGMGMGKRIRKKRCGDNDVNHLPLLPDVDFLIQEILVCLPVKSLLRFKSVCKSWRELIQSSFFIDLHTTSSSRFGAFVLQTTEHYVGSYGFFVKLVKLSLEKYEADIKLYMLSSESGDSDGDGEDDNNKDNDDDDQKKKKMVFKVDDLGFLPFYKDYELEDALRMVGSCNGIICLHDPNVMDEHRGTIQDYSNLRDVCLWNPATRQFRILPKSIPIHEKTRYMGDIFDDFIAFGFDVKTKDYKVLRISRWDYTQESEEGGCMCRVQVYSLSTDSWRLLEDINSLPVVPDQGEFFPNHGIYLNGSYFFVAKKFTHGNSDSMMLSFDFTKEIFTTMQLPDKCSTHICELVLSYLGEKLVVCASQMDIWVLNEQHGGGGVNKESWNKLHTTFGISDNREFALVSTITVDGYKLQLFNLVTKEAKNNFLIGTSKCRADVYKESLVSIMSSGNDLLRWQLPTHGTTYRLNLDAPFIDSYRPFGIGLCLISDTGGCIGVRSLRKRGVRDEEEGEAMAMLEAIKWAKELDLSPIIIESDSEDCVSFFIDGDDDDDDDDDLTYWSSKALSLLEEAKLLNSSETGISLKYCSRSCNYVADIAAKLGWEGYTHSSRDWSSANFPGEMVRSLSKDLALPRCRPM